jgi:hypothetical protein
MWTLVTWRLTFGALQTSTATANECDACVWSIMSSGSQQLRSCLRPPPETLQGQGPRHSLRLPRCPPAHTSVHVHYDPHNYKTYRDIILTKLSCSGAHPKQNLPPPPPPPLTAPVVVGVVGVVVNRRICYIVCFVSYLIREILPYDPGA